MAARERQIERGVRESPRSPAPSKDMVLLLQWVFQRTCKDLPVPAAGHHTGRHGHRGAGFDTITLEHLFSVLSMLTWKKKEVCELMGFNGNT